MFTTKSVKIFDQNILYPTRKLHVWTRDGIDEFILNNDLWGFEYDAEVVWGCDDELCLTNIDYHCSERIKIQDIENGFAKIELI